eukprot:CAMPEP_0116044868 /NCGR_PEP_ID=MMETSP0321-20121206/27265_1 /TAXON_ID=163516 /ORGANISM="Leptocylindrus danicus var. danicus, Strain B650" /LENGTH=224 /DNA_ID=CAMNT_0003526065 /DNA_START=127 /DNA_END=798 /DNA_ORIENTATION=+
MTVFPDPLAQYQKTPGAAATYQNKSGTRRKERQTDPSEFPLDLSAGGISNPGTDIAWTPKNAFTYLDENVELSAPKCPEGGPGGLVCCEVCTISYARYLNQTTAEMDAHNVSKVGEEVNELLELLHDAQKRLKAAVNMAQEHEVQRGIIHEKIQDGTLNLSANVPAVAGKVSTPALPAFPLGDMSAEFSSPAVPTIDIDVDLPVENGTSDLVEKNGENVHERTV